MAVNASTNQLDIDNNISPINASTTGSKKKIVAGYYNKYGLLIGAPGGSWQAVQYDPVTTISSSNTDSEIPTALGVRNYFIKSCFKANDANYGNKRINAGLTLNSSYTSYFGVGSSYIYYIGNGFYYLWLTMWILPGQTLTKAAGNYFEVLYSTNANFPLCSLRSPLIWVPRSSYVRVSGVLGMYLDTGSGTRNSLMFSTSSDVTFSCSSTSIEGSFMIGGVFYSTADVTF